jgi:3-oxoacyl-[acyl-carrier protein] reductase
MDFTNKKALVTGGSAGIGKAIAQALIERGAKVAITARGEDRLKKAAEEIGATAIHADAGKPDDCVRSVREANEALGGLDILINNAGFGYHSLLNDLDADKFRDVWATNVLGAALTAREASKIFCEQRSGNIVNIASTSGTKGYRGGTPYCATKFALRGMTECWQAELRPFNVRVISVCPSEVQTNFGGRERETINPKKLVSEDIAHATIAALEMNERGFMPEFKIIATNPWDDQ